MLSRVIRRRRRRKRSTRRLTITNEVFPEEDSKDPEEESKDVVLDVTTTPVPDIEVQFSWF